MTAPGRARVSGLAAGAALLLAAVALAHAGDRADDWPQFRGPNRDGISPETGLLKNWPDQGPPLLWRRDLGQGFSAISVYQGLAYTMYSDDRDEFAICVNAEDGREVWRLRTDKSYKNSWGNGPRATALIDGDTVFFIGAQGKLYALNRLDGRVLWHRDLPRDNEGVQPDLGYSNSPLIAGDLILVTTGGFGGNAIQALDKSSGAVRWTAHSDHPGYSSPITLGYGPADLGIFFTGTGIVAVELHDGAVLWTYPWRTSAFENVASPVRVGENRLFFSSPHPRGKGSAVLTFTRSGDDWSTETVWQNNVMKNHFSTSVFVDGFLYGCDRAILKCVDARTGEERWRRRGFGEGNVIAADGHLIILGTSGQLALAEITPEAYRQKGQVRILSGRCFTAPSLSQGRLYLRNRREMISFDVRAPDAAGPASGH
jgi:outer membrane protein assembly factor BamB